MIRSRIGLDNIFRSIAPNVYFQPPETIKMKYPCIIYNLSDINSRNADNLPYMVTKRYHVIVVDKDPDSIIKDRVALLPMCNFLNHITKDDLNQDNFEIYY